eukprot:scpid559/ scgid30462/ 
MMAMNGLTGHGMSEEKEYSLATFLMNLDDGDLEYDEDMFKLPADVIPNDMVAENKGFGLYDFQEAETSFQNSDGKAAQMEFENIDSDRHFIVNPIFQAAEEDMDGAAAVAPSTGDKMAYVKYTGADQEQTSTPSGLEFSNPLFKLGGEDMHLPQVSIEEL